MSDVCDKILIGLDAEETKAIAEAINRNYGLSYSLDQLSWNFTSTGQKTVDESIRAYFRGANGENFEIFRCTLRDFTGNCGMKAISYIYFLYVKHWNPTKFFSAFENWLFTRRQVGILVGSDWTSGTTLMNIKTYGSNYEFSKETHNPNYSSNLDHTIQLFWKYLKPL